MIERVRREDRPDRPALAIIMVDNPPVNAMSPGIPGGILAHLATAEACPEIRGALIVAGGRGGFSGADIRFQGGAWPEAEPKLIDLIDGLERGTFPVAILLQQHALGGGLEIAMACHWRIAAPGTRLGQPEIKLGIPPGAGGTQRLPRLVGVQRALDIILSGEPIDATEAAEAGLVDCLTGSAQPLEDAAAQFDAWLSNPVIPLKASERVVANADRTAVEAARDRAARKMRGEPAAAACIDAIEAAVTMPFAEGLRLERARFLECVVSPEAAALRHLFFAERSARQVEGVAKSTRPAPPTIAAVIGGGTMGVGIALTLLPVMDGVILIERDQAALDRATKRI
ncbi:MAG: enoyl-CoA hydratase-related protein, partial [Pseudomonadota bacterium]